MHDTVGESQQPHSGEHSQVYTGQHWTGLKTKSNIVNNYDVVYWIMTFKVHLHVQGMQNAGNEAAVHGMIVMIPQKLCCWLMPVMLLLMVGISFPKRGLYIYSYTGRHSQSTLPLPGDYSFDYFPSGP